jgi:hypothetical protein
MAAELEEEVAEAPVVTGDLRRGGRKVVGKTDGGGGLRGGSGRRMAVGAPPAGSVGLTTGRPGTGRGRSVQSGGSPRAT